MVYLIAMHLNFPHFTKHLSTCLAQTQQYLTK